MDKIDDLDKRILDIVMNNARIASKDVAQVCGVSRAAVHQRLQRMIDVGVISGSGYYVDPHDLGYGVCAYIVAKLERGPAYDQVVPELRKIPEVVECHFITGPYDLLLKVYARDNARLNQLLNGSLLHIAGITATQTMISLDRPFVRKVPAVVPQ